MKETTIDSRNEVQLCLVDQLEDLDIADDLALLAYTHSWDARKKPNNLNLSHLN